MPYIEFPVETDIEDNLARAFAEMRAIFPAWTANEAHLEVALIEEFARMSTETAQSAGFVSQLVFARWGQLVGIEQSPGVRAGTTADFTVQDDAGYTIPAATGVALRVAGDDFRLFLTQADIVIPPGQTEVLGVPLEAAVVGTDYNGIAAAPASLTEQYAFITSVETTTITTGGIDPEDFDGYVDRLSEDLRLLTPRPILPDDFAILARNVPGVARARAINGFNPVDLSYGNERMVTVVGLDVNGDALSDTTDNELEQYLDSQREINFVVNTFKPQYLPLHIVYDLVTDVGLDPIGVQDAVNAALAAYISPARWAGGDEEPPIWRDVNTVRFWELVAVMNNVPGVAFLNALTINGVASDIDLPTPAGLPKAVGLDPVADSTVEGSVSIP